MAMPGFFMWMLEIQTQVLILLQEAPLPTESGTQAVLTTVNACMIS